MGSGSRRWRQPADGPTGETGRLIGDLTARHLDAVDRGAPGLVDALYVVGSTALGDFQPGRSDIDVVAVTSRPLDQADLGFLAGVHAGMPASPHYDGVYLDWPTVRAMRADEAVVPHVVDGAFRDGERCGELNPILWLTLLRRGITVRGPRPADLGLRVDPGQLRRYNLDNLGSYWQPLAEQARQATADREPTAPVTGEAVAWMVLGAARLHYTLATGDIASKSAAAGHVAANFPGWADLARRKRCRVRTVRDDDAKKCVRLDP